MSDAPVIHGSTKQQRYESLVATLYQDVYRYAFWLCKSQPLAEDLVQETFLRAWRSLESLQNDKATKAWLFTILRNTYINTYRKTVRRQRVDFDQVAHLYAAPETSPEWADRGSVEEMLRHVVQDDVKRALDELPEDYRTVVLLADLEDCSYKEIAVIVGCPVGTVMSRLFRGRRLLRKSLADFARKAGYIKG